MGFSARPGGQRRAADGRGGGEGDGDVLGPVDEVRLQALDLAIEADVGYPFEQAIEHDHDLHACEVRPQAEVRSAAAEGDVVVRGSSDVEGVRVVEGVLVAVR